MNFQRRNENPSDAKSFSASLFGRPTERSYRAAVKQVILDLKARSGMSASELAPILGCCKETIDNAEDEASSLNVLTLLNIAYAFDEHAIDPVRSLYLCAPAEEPDALDLIERGVAKLRRERA